LVTVLFPCRLRFMLRTYYCRLVSDTCLMLGPSYSSARPPLPMVFGMNFTMHPCTSCGSHVLVSLVDVWLGLFLSVSLVISPRSSSCSSRSPSNSWKITN
jgi:hypothetical protein